MKMKRHTVQVTHTDSAFCDLRIPNVSDVTCMDPGGIRTPMVVEKLCKTVRLICFLVQNGVSKSKVMQDVHVMMKRGTKHLGKSLNNAMLRHHEALTCRSRDSHMSFVSPIEYQFSCNGSPPRLSYTTSAGRRKNASPPYTRRHQHHALLPYGLCRGNHVETTKLVGSGLGHGYYHNMGLGNRVKITDPASMLSDCDDVVGLEYRVDQAAQEFIDRFHRDLRLQKWLDLYC